MLFEPKHQGFTLVVEELIFQHASTCYKYVKPDNVNIDHRLIKIDQLNTAFYTRAVSQESATQRIRLSVTSKVPELIKSRQIKH